MLVKWVRLVWLVKLAKWDTLVNLVMLVKLVKLVCVHSFDIWTSKKAQYPQFLTLLTSKCASRHNGMHFFNVSTSKSGPHMVCLLHFDLEMCFAPQWRALLTSQLPKVVRACPSMCSWHCELEMCVAPQWRALFRHVNFHKWSEAEVLCTFWLGNVLRATTVHFFDISTSQSAPNVRCFYLFYFKMCFSPQRRVTFHLSSGQMAPHPPLQQAYFSTLQSHKSLGKHSETRLSYILGHLHLLSSLIFSLLFFSSLTLPTSAFPTVHIVGSFTSKLPSINIYIHIIYIYTYICLNCIHI